MQDVFLAHDELLDGDVALKAPQVGQATKRFRQSAIFAARVNHHNVAKTLDYFEERDGVFLIEEFVPGENLESKLGRFTVVDPHLGAQILHHLCKGVAASHHAGVVHRDLKPSNIMTEKGANLHHLKITDFGIATLTESVFNDAAKAGDLTQSTSGTIRGALPYMAPEMMFRDPQCPPGAAMDIWSIGALMFRMLTGQYPFGVYLDAAVNVKNRSRASWPKFMIANAQFRPLAEELQGIIENCLSYEPSERPTADDLVRQCDELCYLTADREEGQISQFIQNGYSAFIDGPRGKVFCSMQSVYGPKSPDTAVNSRVCYAAFSGQPHPRGHPIVVVG